MSICEDHILDNLIDSNIVPAVVYNFLSRIFQQSYFHPKVMFLH